MTGLPDDLLLPPRARLLHIGPPKTGSTALQTAAAAHRAQLLAEGVRYPGRRKSQRLAIAAFLGRSIGFVSGDPAGSVPPDRAEWDALMAEIEGDAEHRIWLGHEYAAGSDDATAARMVEALGQTITLIGPSMARTGQHKERKSACSDHGAVRQRLGRILERMNSPATAVQSLSMKCLVDFFGRGQRCSRRCGPASPKMLGSVATT